MHVAAPTAPIPEARHQSIDTHRSGAVVIATTDDQGILLRIALDPEATAWRTVRTGLIGTTPCVKIERLGPERRIRLAWQRAGHILTATTLDEGTTWSMSEVIGAGENPAIVTTPDGRVCFYWRAGSSIKGLIRDAQGRTIVPEFTAVSGNVDPDAIDAADRMLGYGAWRIELVYRSGGNLVVRHSLDGVNFI